MKKYFGYIKTILLLTFVGFVFGFTAKRNEKRKIKTIKIVFGGEDNLFLNHQMVDNLLIQNNRRILKQPKSLINLHEVEQVVQVHPMVKEAQVSIGVSGDLKVNVLQKKPLARVYQQNEVFYLDTKGLKMPLSNNYSARVLIVDNTNKRITSKEVFPLIKQIDADDFFKKIIVAIKKNNEGYWLQTRFHQQKVLLGNIDDAKQKLKKLKVFYNYMEQDSLSKTFKKIDLQYNNQIVCSK